MEFVAANDACFALEWKRPVRPNIWRADGERTCEDPSGEGCKGADWYAEDPNNTALNDNLVVLDEGEDTRAAGVRFCRPGRVAAAPRRLHGGVAAVPRRRRGGIAAAPW